jgi:probable rRNA maturation factor
MPIRRLSLAHRHPHLRVDRRGLTRVIATLDANAAQFRSGCPAGELSLVFLTDAALAQLHADFLDDPTPTDVITFEGNLAHAFAGEICVSADAARRQLRSPLRASKSKSSARKAPSLAKSDAEEFSAELLLYVIHGWLHLAGYDDVQPSKKREMRRAETRALKLVRPSTGGLLFRLVK